MPWLTAGMTLVPSARPMSTRALADERDEVGVDLVLEGRRRGPARRSSRLLGEVERRELDARDVAEPRPTLGSGRRRRRRARGDDAPTCTRPRAIDGGDGDGDEGRERRRLTGPPGHGLTATSGWRGADEPALDEDDDEVQAMPSSAMVRSVANMSGMSNSEPRARLMRTPRPRSAPGPLPDDRADDGEGHPDPHPAEDRRQGRRDLEGREDLAAGRPQRPAELEQPGVDRPDADHRRDRDREEDDQRADDDLAEEAGPEPQGDERREGEDRRRLGGDEVRRQEALDERAAGEA